MQGTCELVFHTSGQTYEEKDPIIINPKDVRNMAGWVIDQCVSDQGEGGAISKGTSAVVDWIINPLNRFEVDPMRTLSYPMRTCESFCIACSSTDSFLQFC